MSLETSSQRRELANPRKHASRRKANSVGDSPSPGRVKHSTDSFPETKKISLSEKSVEAGIGLSSLAHEAGQSDDVLLSSHFAILINLSNRHAQMLKPIVAFIQMDTLGRMRKGTLTSYCLERVTYTGDLNLDRGVVLGSDESVGGGALSGDVDIHNISVVVLHLYYF